MQLYLMQHGEALAAEIDRERALSEKGITDIHQIANFLQKNTIRIQRIIHSQKKRAAQTAAIIASISGLTSQTESSDLLNPNENPQPFIESLITQPLNTLVIGHLPFLAKMVNLLCKQQSSDLIVSFQPGSIVCIESSANHEWYINWMIRPDIL